MAATSMVESACNRHATLSGPNNPWSITGW
jgi:hypothetical protein